MKPSEVAARITEVEPFVCHWDDDEKYVATCGYCQAQGGGCEEDQPIVHLQDCPWLLAQKTMPALLAVVEAAVAWREADKRYGECPSCSSTLGVLEAEALSEMVRAVDAFMATSDAATDEPRIGKSHTGEML